MSNVFEKFQYHRQDGNSVLIREAQPSDAADLLSYVEDLAGETAYLTMVPGEFSLTEAQEAAYLAQCHESPNQIYIVAEIDGYLVGSASLSSSSRIRIRHVCTLGISVRQAYWQQGIGRALLKSIIGWARANVMLTKMDLSVRADHRAAIALYRSVGFVDEGRRSRQLKVDGIDFDTIEMGLLLSAD